MRRVVGCYYCGELVTARPNVLRRKYKCPECGFTTAVRPDGDSPNYGVYFLLRILLICAFAALFWFGAKYVYVWFEDINVYIGVVLAAGTAAVLLVVLPLLRLLALWLFYPERPGAEIKERRIHIHIRGITIHRAVNCIHCGALITESPHTLGGTYKCERCGDVTDVTDNHRSPHYLLFYLLITVLLGLAIFLAVEAYYFTKEYFEGGVASLSLLLIWYAAEFFAAVHIYNAAAILLLCPKKPEREIPREERPRGIRVSRVITCNRCGEVITERPALFETSFRCGHCGHVTPLAGGSKRSKTGRFFFALMDVLFFVGCSILSEYFPDLEALTGRHLAALIDVVLLTVYIRCVLLPVTHVVNLLTFYPKESKNQ